MLTGKIYLMEELSLLPLFLFLLMMVLMVEPMVGFGFQLLFYF